MNIVSNSVKLIAMTPEPLKLIEYAGRTCYASRDKITDTSAKAFVQNLLIKGHTSVLEHASATFDIVCDRGVSHELVRHRIASYSQESTRYVKYDNLKFIQPTINEPIPGEVDTWEYAMRRCEMAYKDLMAYRSQEIARSVLPNSLATTVVMTANFREWRHFLTLRLSKRAHPDMRDIAKRILKELQDAVAVVFDDFETLIS